MVTHARSAPAMRFSIGTRKVTPSLLAMDCASAIIAAASAKRRVTARYLTSVARDKALMRIEGQIAPQLEPDLGADVGEHRCLQARPDEAARDSLGSLTAGAVRLADREPVAFDVADHAMRDHFNGRIDDATNHRSGGM